MLEVPPISLYNICNENKGKIPYIANSGGVENIARKP